jgi:hypothetical protein
MLLSLKVTCQSLVEKLILDFDYLVASCQNTFAPNRCCSRCSGGTWSGNFLLHEETTDAAPETSKGFRTVDGIGSSSYLRKNGR